MSRAFVRDEEDEVDTYLAKALLAKTSYTLHNP